uniref:Cilia- and flagella-associated protein 300 n=1 Tax=Ascaris lumbricoides TaxID=6252 RepID=A0A0M3HUH8_ASCLU
MVEGSNKMTFWRAVYFSRLFIRRELVDLFAIRPLYMPSSFKLSKTCLYSRRVVDFGRMSVEKLREDRPVFAHPHANTVTSAVSVFVAYNQPLEKENERWDMWGCLAGYNALLSSVSRKSKDEIVLLLTIR